MAASAVALAMHTVQADGLNPKGTQPGEPLAHRLNYSGVESRRERERERGVYFYLTLDIIRTAWKAKGISSLIRVDGGYVIQCFLASQQTKQKQIKNKQKNNKKREREKKGRKTKEEKKRERGKKKKNLIRTGHSIKELKKRKKKLIMNNGMQVSSDFCIVGVGRM